MENYKHIWLSYKMQIRPDDTVVLYRVAQPKKLDKRRIDVLPKTYPSVDKAMKANGLNFEDFKLLKTRRPELK